MPGPVRERLAVDLERLPAQQWLPLAFGLWAPSATEIWLLTTPPGANPTRFLVLSPNGGVTASVTVPMAMTPLEVTPTTILGSSEDADGEIELIGLTIRRP
jgi:hypothetical protein